MIMPDTIITAYVAFNVWVGYRSEPIFRLSNMRGLPINIAQEERTITFFIVLTASWNPHQKILIRPGGLYIPPYF